MSNVVTAVFRDGATSCRAPGLWQWDYGQELQITGLSDLPRTPEIHFAQSSLRATRIGLTEDEICTVAIPDTMIQTAVPIDVYVYIHTGNEDGETEYHITLPIKARTEPVDYDIEDPDVSAAYQALVDATQLMESDIETVEGLTQTVEGYRDDAESAARSASESAQTATQQAGAASSSAQAAAQSETNAGNRASAASGSATLAESYAAGGTGTRTGEDTDNAKYYKERAGQSASDAESAKEAVLGMRVTITTLAPGSPATASYSDGVLALGVPAGVQGETGNGISTITLNADYTLTITFTNGTSATTRSIRGATGITPDFSIGTVSTGDAGSGASATITGTAEEPILSLTIPKGTTFTPSVSDEGILSWTNDGGLVNPDSVNIAEAVREMLIVTVSGTDPVIVAEANTRYICGEVLSLSFTPPETGMAEVIFTSGTSVTLLTLPSTVKMPDWFDASSLDTETIYEINISDGVYGAVMTWQL